MDTSIWGRDVKFKITNRSNLFGLMVSNPYFSILVIFEVTRVISNPFSKSLPQVKSFTPNAPSVFSNIVLPFVAWMNGQNTD